MAVHPITGVDPLVAAEAALLVAAVGVAVVDPAAEVHPVALLARVVAAVAASSLSRPVMALRLHPRLSLPPAIRLRRLIIAGVGGPGLVPRPNSG